MVSLISSLHVEVVLRGILVLIAAILIARLVHFILYKVLWRLQAWLGRAAGTIFLTRTSKSSQALLIVIALNIGIREVPLEPWAEAIADHVVEIGYIVVFTWLIICFIEGGYALLLQRLPDDAHEDIRARRIRTEVYLLRQIAIWVVAFIGFAAILMTFPSIRNIGAGLFASAGVAGLVLGMAARPTLGNLIAGIQIALSQPLRIGDTVVVEGQFGRVLEINTTYVVIRLWDLRHLIVPISQFIERSFENWTRYSSELIGAVYLHMDYTVPVDALRDYYTKILADSPLWDGKTSAVQVTDATGSTMEVRFLMSAQSAPSAFELRCYVREMMLSYLQQQYPGSLPKVRTEISLTGVSNAASSRVPERMSSHLSATRESDYGPTSGQ